eukprot:239441-Chlamydomonas_euryale.AAC.2
MDKLPFKLRLDASNTGPPGLLHPKAWTVGLRAAHVRAQPSGEAEVCRCAARQTKSLDPRP